MTPVHRPAASADVALPGHAWLPSGAARKRLDDSPLAYLKIASGCDRRCTFCAIPSFRGSFVSRPPGDILAEARWLAGSGARELVLVSENSTSYGKDLGDLRALEALLPALAAVDGIELIRVSYLQPAELRPSLLEAIATTPGVAPYFDLSFQHSSPEVLRRMKRFGSTDAFLDILERVRAIVPDAGARSNVIVGFPGETEDDLAELERFLTGARLDVVGVFGYSDEDGTDAETFSGKLSVGEIAERVEHVTAARRRADGAAGRGPCRVDGRRPRRGRRRAHRPGDPSGTRDRRRHATHRSGRARPVRAGPNHRQRGDRPRRRSPGPGTVSPPARRLNLEPVGDDPIADPPDAVSAWNLANALTIFRLALVPVFLLALMWGTGHQSGWRITAWAVFAVASVTDRFDGELARKRNMITEFGKLADPIADKALAGAALIGLSALGDLPWWLTVVMLVREVGVTVLRFWVIRHGVIAASRGGKIKTLLQAVAIGLFVLPPWGWLRGVAWVVMVAAIVVALLTGLDYVGRAVRLRRSARASRFAI